MEQCTIKFKANTLNSAGGLKFNCQVEYPGILDPFMSPELKKQTDWKGSVIMPFSGGQGSFSSNSLEQAESLEEELKTKIQAAYEDMLQWQERVGHWVGTREYDLVSPEVHEKWSPRRA